MFLVMPGVVIRQRKPYRRKNGVFIHFEGEFETWFSFFWVKLIMSWCFSILLKFNNTLKAFDDFKSRQKSAKLCVWYVRLLIRHFCLQPFFPQRVSFFTVSIVQWLLVVALLKGNFWNLGMQIAGKYIFLGFFLEF